MEICVTLSQALKKISRSVSVVSGEKIQLSDSCGRVCASPCRARFSFPAFPRAAYDGYVVGNQRPAVAGDMVEYRLAGDIAAGDSGERRLSKGVACPIMTGAPVPAGGWKVIPLEFCTVHGKELTVPGKVLEKGASHIQQSGSFVRKGSLVLGKGERVTPAHMAKLAECGCGELEVRRRPRIAFFNTGSELTDDLSNRQRGKIASSNKYLLSSLIDQCGCHGEDLGIAQDTTKALRNRLHLSVESKAEVIISTGGMGPGKYDLVKKVFREQGGEICFSSLQLRPGKSTLFGILGNSLFFGLPGPPAAVLPLFHILIVPALNRLQGVRKGQPLSMQAHLDSDLEIKKPGPPLLLPAMLGQNRGVLCIRPADRYEVCDSYLLCPGRRRYLSRNQLLRVQSLSMPPL